MSKTLTAALILLAMTSVALGETVTVTTTLGQRGFSDGFLVSSRQASTLYLPLPAGVDVSNVRIRMKARAVTPNMQRGSVVVSVNGQPIDALRLQENPRAQFVALDTVLNQGEPFHAPALELRFRADLIAHTEFCIGDFDSANTLQILPETTVAYDVDLDAVTTLGDALALLPVQPVVQLPTPLTPEASAEALKVAAMLANMGYRAHLADKIDAAAPASLQLVAPSADGAIRLVHEAGRLRIDVPENADIAAFARLWQAAPLALAGEEVSAKGTNAVVRGAVDSFWPFPTLPGPLRVVQTGELGLDFPMLDVNGRRASQAKLRLTVAPDWSNAKPIITLYLNGQLITARRAEIGENIVSAGLPSDLLRLTNQLSVTVDRAQVEGYCPGDNPGHAVQLLPGTGIDYDGTATGGFAAVAGALRQGGTLVLPEAAKGEDGLAYLTLASRVLSGLGVGAAPVDVTFGKPSKPTGPILSIGRAGAEGLMLPIAVNRVLPDVELSSDQPLASLKADADGKKLDILVLEGQDLPDPTGIYLGNSGKALVGPDGVIWQDTASGSDPSLVERAREVSNGLNDVMSTQGLFYGLLGLAVIVVVLLARALLKRFFRRKAAK